LHDVNAYSGGVTTITAAVPDSSFIESLTRDVQVEARRLGSDLTLDVWFLGYLRRLSRFGYFALGPITIDVNLIDTMVERTARPGDPRAASEDFERFSRILMQEVRRSGRKRIDELHMLLAFMRCGEGLPARVFGELGVTPEEVESYLKRTGGAAVEPIERLMTPEEVAEYLRVHVQTVRAWIRSGMLPARRVAGLRSLRVRFADAAKLLEPLDRQEDA
jgi:excisionase family DNA binding protein